MAKAAATSSLEPTGTHLLATSTTATATGATSLVTYVCLFTAYYLLRGLVHARVLFLSLLVLLRLSHSIFSNASSKLSAFTAFSLNEIE